MSRATCPWATPALAMSRTPRGLDASRSAFCVEFDVPVGTTKGIAAFYPAVTGMPAECSDGTARVRASKGQFLQFRETDALQGEFDGHHVQIYITDFSGPYRKPLSASWCRARTTCTSTALRHRRSVQRQAPVHGRTRSAQRHPPDVPAAAGQPQPGADQHDVRGGHEISGRGRCRRISTLDEENLHVIASAAKQSRGHKKDWIASLRSQ